MNSWQKAMDHACTVLHKRRSFTERPVRLRVYGVRLGNGDWFYVVGYAK